MLRLFVFWAIPTADSMFVRIRSASLMCDYDPESCAAVPVDGIHKLLATEAARYTLSQKYPLTVNLPQGKER